MLLLVMVFSGFNIELYVMAFDFENTSCQFYEIEKLKLPSSPKLYTTIEETIENLASFKVKCSIYTGQVMYD